ncbi:stearoyl-CoA 9-desaturase, partial [Malassezia sp. CBS 17886]
MPLQAVLMCMGSGAVEGSIKWWARGHRSHHRYTDTDLDPYSAHKGLLHAHVGWMILKPRRKPGPVDISDLQKNKVVQFQHRYYLPMILLWGLVFPTVVAGLLWGDWAGGFYFAAVARLVFVHHSTFCINSLAHYLGEASFDAKHTPRDNMITAFATIGEGYHNFHHEFPMDFRNAVKWYQYDPTKWFIWGMGKLGAAWNLKVFPDNEVRKGRLAMEMRRAYKESKELSYSKKVHDLPVYTWDEYEAMAKERAVIVIHGYIHD